MLKTFVITSLLLLNFVHANTFQLTADGSAWGLNFKSTCESAKSNAIDNAYRTCREAGAHLVNYSVSNTCDSKEISGLYKKTYAITFSCISINAGDGSLSF